MSDNKRAAQLDREIKEVLSRKSPLRVVCRTLAFGIKSCDWKIVGEFRGAEFVSRVDSHKSAIVHPSTKFVGRWQTSFFDELGPVSDAQHPDAEGALRQVPPRKWKLRALP